MSKTKSITIRKGLSIYKQPKSKGKGSPNWYARVYLEFGGRSVHTKSTGTTDQKSALLMAEQYRTDCLMSSRHFKGTGEVPPNFKSNGVRFDRVADAFLDNLQRASSSDKTSQRNLADYRGAVNSKSGFIRFFGKDDVANITMDRISEYLEYQRTNSRKGTLAATSQKRTLVLLNVILKFAVQKRWLVNLPPQPKLKTKDTPRAWFEKSEYLKLMATARSLANKAKQESDAEAEEKWLELNDFIMFMVNTFLRPVPRQHSIDRLAA